MNELFRLLLGRHSSSYVEKNNGEGVIIMQSSYFLVFRFK